MATALEARHPRELSDDAARLLALQELPPLEKLLDALCELRTVAVAAIGTDFAAALGDRSCSSIPARVAAAKRTEEVVEAHGLAVRALALCGRGNELQGEPSIVACLRKELEARLREHLAGPYKPFGSLAEVSALYGELRRVVAELRVRFQPLLVHDPQMHMGALVWARVAERFSDMSQRKMIMLALHDVELHRNTGGVSGSLAGACDALLFNIRIQPFSRAREATETVFAPGSDGAAYVEQHITAPLLRGLHRFCGAVSFNEDVDAYLTAVCALVEEEAARVSAVFGAPFFPPDLSQRAKVTMHEVLLGARGEAIVRHPTLGVAQQLVYPALSASGFQRLFKILEFSPPCVELILEEFRNSVKAAAFGLLAPSPTSNAYPALSLEAVMMLWAAYNTLLQRVPPAPRLAFLDALQTILTGLSRSSDLAVQLALHFDAIIKKCEGGGGVGAAARASLGEAAAVLPLIRDTARLLAHYRALLAARLTQRPKPSIAAERTALNVLGGHLGQQAVLPLLLMLAEVQHQPSTCGRGRGDGGEGHLRLVNGLLWPHSMSWLSSSAWCSGCCDGDANEGDNGGDDVAAAAGALLRQARPIAEAAQLVLTPDAALSSAEFAVLLPGATHHLIVRGSVLQLLVFRHVAAAGTATPRAIAEHLLRRSPQPQERRSGGKGGGGGGGGGGGEKEAEPTAGSHRDDGHRDAAASAEILHMATADLHAVAKTLVAARLLVEGEGGYGALTVNKAYMAEATATKKIVLPLLRLSKPR